MSAAPTAVQMSGQPPFRQLLGMGVGDLDAVLAIEQAAYAFPWSRGNFIDSLASGYIAQVLLDETGALLGYFIAMAGGEEMHLLNITVAPAHEHRGHARFMLDALATLCDPFGARQIWLEVRESNQRAQAIYLRRGFTQVGRRKAYYPAPDGQREDALLMSLPIPVIASAPSHIEIITESNHGLE